MEFRYNLDEILAIAEEIERNGARFYRSAARRVEDEETRKLLEELATWEQGHEALFADIRSQLAADTRTHEVHDPEGEGEGYLRAMASNHVFRSQDDPASLLGRHPTTREVLDLALRFERDSILLFLGMKGVVTESFGPPEVERLVQEERRHVAWLYQRQQQLTPTGS